MNILLLCTCAALLALTSCRTNDIARYPVRDQVILYRTSVAGDAADAHLHITGPSSNPVGNIFTDIGAGIAGMEARSKLSRAVVPDSLGKGLASGIQDVLRTYFGARTAVSPADSPAYIVEITLEKYQVHSGEYGLYARVEGEAKMYQTGTGRLLWETDESASVPLSRGGGYHGQRSIAGTAMSIFHASELLNMSDEELRNVLIRAAEEAGRIIGDQLREDIADN